MKILLVDDQPVARRGLRVVVTESFGGCEVLEADNAAAALDISRLERPGMVLLDVRIPGLTPPDELCRAFRELLPEGVLVLVTAVDDVSVIHACLDAGADGCLLKDVSEVHLGAALRAMAAGAFVADPRIVRQIGREAAKPLVAEAVRQATQGHATQPGRTDGEQQPEGAVFLTGREHDVLRLLAHGYSNRAIARELFLSETTVKGYVRGLLTKLEAPSRLVAVIRACELGLASLPERGSGRG
ncbi:response regulator [Streptomyces rugosispiralis]|uniref:Response regulator transcription factor n=1 Tax=Streptomyces rugosispiralis TaxID=2967341 RepID=A0ABT1V5M6_9ACTN|nr:response regulator transcription factor [Streptomyces rugosispiralis]MCQ8192695.1 response regulator transcription factor [Streptomyces rugosispiralis]